jgi:hypothetical protein
MRTREHFDNELGDLEDEILRLGTTVRHLSRKAWRRSRLRTRRSATT